jgi:hypothetical protein
MAVYQCDSQLQMRLALQGASETASTTVLITPLDQTKVSDDILVRMALRKLHPINSWEIVKSLFKARELDPRITRHSFLADLLLEHAGAGNRDFPPVAGGCLDAETVWNILLSERLGLSGAHPDVVELLRCTAEFDLAGQWKTCPAEFRNAARDWIGETAGEVAKVVLKCIESEHGATALAVGLAMGIVYDDTVGHDLDKAAGRLEAYVGTNNLSIEYARLWRAAASIALTHVQKATLRHCLDDAETIVENIGAGSHAWRSSVLESGFEQRLSRLGEAIAIHVDSRATAIPPELLKLFDAAREHRLARASGRRMERIAMAVRLLRWLADKNAEKTGRPSGLLAIAQRYASDGGFVDWARQVLCGGEANKDLATSFVRLVARVTEFRQEENRRFGQALREEQAMGAAALGLIPVEQIIDHLITEAAKAAPVLLLLVDGMSWAVFLELISDIKTRDWIELSFGTTLSRFVGLAALPSVTEVSRTSLFCGELRRGQAADETQGFAAHPRLVAESLPGFPPKLFHKAALRDEDDSSLASDIRGALANKKQRVVGVVINAVDDYLDKGDQVDVTWTMQRIRVLEPILAEARAAGRLVILLSDHGHVLDRETEVGGGTDGLRWRRPGDEKTEGEVEVSSARVMLPDGGRVVVPWSERIRYGSKKNGYHGGATPQEMLIPVALLWPELDEPEGYEELPDMLPSWWAEPTVARLAPVAAKQPQRPAKADVLPLFDRHRIPRAESTGDDLWIKALLQSEVFATQKRKLAGRAPIDDATVQKLVATLVSRGGSMTATALASAVGVPAHRLPGFLAVIQRLLNVDGFSILDRQEAANTVVLNISLLKKQFELGQ